MKKLIILRILPIVIILLVSCQEKRTDYSKIMICTELLSDSALKILRQPSVVARNIFRWPTSQDMPLTLIVKFINGTPFQRRKVQQYSKYWENETVLGSNNRHKITFAFVPDNFPGNSDVRIAFLPGGSASAVGQDCRNVPQSDPTTTFGWVDEYHADDEIRQVILHELGHILGLEREHQSPVANIPWNKNAVYSYYWRTQNPPWDHAKVDQNVFQRYSEEETRHTKFDSLSIMCYAIPEELTNVGYSTPWNSNLSVTDKSFIKQYYPYEPCIPGETCCFDRKGKRIPCP